MHTALRYGKLGLTWSVVVSTIAWSIGLAALIAPLAAVNAAQAGDLIKASQPAVYYYGSDGKRYVFPNEKTYKTWYADFSSVKTVTDAELAAIPIGGNVTYRPGVKMVKITTDPKVYAVDSMGTLRWVTSEAIAIALYGANWNKMIDDVADAFFVNYKTGNAINTAGDFDKATATTNATSINVDKNLGGVVNTGSVSISLASDTPASGMAVNNAAFVPFTKLIVTNSGSNDATIDQMVVTRAGLGQDAAFSGVDLLDSATGLPTESSSKTFNSEHQSTFNKDLVVKAGTSKTLTIAGSFGTNTAYAGEAPVLCLTSVTMAGSGTAAGTYPVCGNHQVINATITIGSAQINRGSLGNATSTNIEVGKTNYNFASFKVVAGSTEKVAVKAVRVYQQGTANLTTDLANIKMYDDASNLLATGVIDGSYINFTFASPVVIEKGQTLQLVIKADIISGSARTVILGIWKHRDIVVTGQTYGYNITTTNQSGCTGCSASSPVLAHNSFTISNGTLEVSRSATVPATNIGVAADQKIGAFLFNAKGERINVEALTLTVASTTSNAAVNKTAITNFRLVDENGRTVMGPTDMPTAGGVKTVSFTDNFTLPLGEHVYTVFANLATSGNWSTNDTLSVSFTPSAMTLTGETTGNSITATPSSSVSGNTQTVKSAGLTVSRKTLPASGTVIVGQNDLRVGAWTLDANSSGEDIRVTSLAFAASSTNVSNLAVYIDGVKQSPVNDAPSVSTVSRNSVGAKIGTSTFNLATPLIIPKGSQKTVELKLNVTTAGVAGQAIAFGMNGSQSVTATGVNTGNTVTASVTNDDGAKMTYAAAGTLTVSIDSKPAAKLVLAGSTGVTATSIKLAAANEALDVDNLVVRVADGGRGATATGNYQDIVQVSLYKGTTLLQAHSIPATGLYQFNFSKGDITVPAGGSQIVTIKVDFSTIDKTNDNAPGTAAADIKVGLGGKNGIKATGQASGSAATETYQDSTSSAMVLHKALPTVAYSKSGSALGANTSFGGAGTYNLSNVDVSADSNGNDVLLYRMTFSISTSGGSTFKANGFYLKDDDGDTIGASTNGTAWNATAGAGVYASFVFNDGDISTEGNNKEAVKVAAGTTRRFYLWGATSNNASGDGITISVMSDTASTSNIINGTCAASGTANCNNAAMWGHSATATGGSFVWSDNFKDLGLSTVGNNATSAAQWYNGDLVSGFSSSATGTPYSLGFSS